tara:strand:- start:275 stop:871 length:597 start_codon:yes stop_codon:yes gene_type:complete
MNNEILLFSELYDTKVVEIVLADFNIKKFDLKELKNKNCKNKNILVFLNDGNNINDLKQISLNNFVLCFVNKKNIEETFNKATIMSSPVTLSKLKEFADKTYKSNSKEYSDVVIADKKLTNKKNKKYTYFTDLENEIFSELLEKKELDKKYLKENILNIKNNIDTRSIESHFSRIRKKLSFIESSIKITSKGEVFFIN